MSLSAVRIVHTLPCFQVTNSFVFHFKRVLEFSVLAVCLLYPGNVRLINLFLECLDMKKFNVAKNYELVQS